MKRIITGLLLASFAITANATTITMADKVKDFNKWSMLKVKDSLTDKVSCIGVYEDNLNVQLYKDMLTIINEVGGVKYITSRIDDGKVSVEEASRLERKVDAAIFNSSVFSSILEGKRLRVRIDPIASLAEEKDFDFDMTGAKEAVEYIKSSECN